MVFLPSWRHKDDHTPHDIHADSKIFVERMHCKTGLLRPGWTGCDVGQMTADDQQVVTRLNVMHSEQWPCTDLPLLIACGFYRVWRSLAVWSAQSNRNSWHWHSTEKDRSHMSICIRWCDDWQKWQPESIVEWLCIIVAQLTHAVFGLVNLSGAKVSMMTHLRHTHTFITYVVHVSHCFFSHTTSVAQQHSG